MMDISVITPFYKGNGYLERLFSCIRQAAAAAPELAVELILVNDSPDCPMEFSQQWVEGFTLRTLENPQNLGIHGARLQGLAQAKGTFVLFLDQDDRIAPQTFASQYALAENADIVLSNGYNENDGGAIYATLAYQRAALKTEYYYSIGCMIVSPGQCLIRREAIPREWKAYPMRCSGADDMFLWLLLLHHGSRWAINPESLYIHVDTGENWSRNQEKMDRSFEEMLGYLKQLGIFTARHENMMHRRWKMRALYAGKPGYYKIVAAVRYPDMAWALLRMKLLSR